MKTGREEMLTQSFLFLPGVQERTERTLWAQGIDTWDHLLDARSLRGVSSMRLGLWKSKVRDVRAALEDERREHVLRRLLPARHAWRAMGELMDEPRFLDIETSEYRTDVTVVGVSDGQFCQSFVQGVNLSTHALRMALRDATCLITFNGASFDLPILERVFPGALPNVPHLDLRHICAQAGLRGGLKRIEQHLALRRADTIREIDGADAILLWHQFLLGDRAALERLVDYNAADVLNLAPLLEIVVPPLWNHIRYDHALPFTPCSALSDERFAV